MQTNLLRRTMVPLAALAILAACGGGGDDASREIELQPAPTDSAPLNDQPSQPAAQPAPAPATKAPAPAPRPAASTPTKTAPARARTGTIASGTSFAVTNAARICTNTHKVGDQFTATLGADVTGTNGARIPAGATVTLTVTESAISKNSKDNWKLAFDVVSVSINGTTYDVTGDVTRVATIEAVRSQSTGQQAGKVATGAAIGAVAGQLLGKDTKSTVIGAAVGAAAGGAVAAGTADYEGCLPANGTITIALGAPLTIPVA